AGYYSALRHVVPNTGKEPNANLRAAIQTNRDQLMFNGGITEALQNLARILRILDLFVWRRARNHFLKDRILDKTTELRVFDSLTHRRDPEQSAKDRENRMRAVQDSHFSCAVGREIVDEPDARRGSIDGQMLLHEFIGFQGKECKRLGTNDQIITVTKRIPLCFKLFWHRWPYDDSIH